MMTHTRAGGAQDTSQLDHNPQIKLTNTSHTASQPGTDILQYNHLALGHCCITLVTLHYTIPGTALFFTGSAALHYM